MNQARQPLAGTGDSPYLYKPDLLSSKFCLVSTPKPIILIDAGALALANCRSGGMAGKKG